MDDYSEMHARMKKRNRAVGLALAALVIFIGVVSFFKIEVLSP
ncbi:MULTISPECIES: hypothetical protein [Kordiimonadales]|uniref:Uncharacterized protein n=1 Tax=Gimibacter soli TaxID=3024400 RepID=A0AAE9XMG3_9PROT|nr:MULTISPECIES: hypothetical protein [Kordiimonadales]WCL53652.1 hypothetical protein PH603_14020 [Gimibacter soli]